MKTLFISLFALWATFFQQTDSLPKEKKTEGVVTYSFQDYGPRKVETHLYFNANKAKYDRHHEGSTIITEEGYEINYKQKYLDWYYENDSLSLFVNKKKYPVFFAQWKKKQIEWKITEETQMIEGFLAKKAITKSLYYETDMGQTIKTNYGDAVAWFTTEIPISYGPDGYNGLPGLIIKLEYTGEKRILKTTLKSIEYKEVKDWQLPNKDKKLEVTQDQAYNYWNYGQKWFKKRAKELGI
jgi:GLPGLI family protein